MATIEDKIQRIINRLELNTSLKSLVPGTTMFSLVEGASYENMKIESAQEVQYLQSSIVTAVGRDLDEIGRRVFGISRRSSIPPTVTSDMKILKLYVNSGSFGGINDGKDIIVQAGTVFEGAIQSGMIKFATKEQITLKKELSEMFISAELILGPHDVIPAGAITTHDITNYTDTFNNSLKVTNISTIATGRPEESDDNYRYRISTALQSFVKTNYFGIHDELTATPGISDVDIASANNGGGTFSVYVKSISPIASAKILDDTKRKIFQNIPPWANVTVTAPFYIGLKVAINVSVYGSSGTLSEQDILKKAISSTVSTFINNVQSRAFSIFEIEDAIVSSNEKIKNATITSASIFKGDTFREETVLDLNNALETYIYLANQEKLVVEPVTNAITVSLQ